MLYALKHFDLKLLIDWAFFENYIYLPPEAIEWYFVKDFKNHIWNQKYKKSLIKWLDDESIWVVNQIEKNIKFLLAKKKCVDKRINFWIKEYDSKTDKYIKKYTKDMYFPVEQREQTCFYYKHWIYEIDDLKNLLKWKDIIDCGAFVWDSAMMFSKELGFENAWGILNHIYCLECDPVNINLLNKTIEKNNMIWKISAIQLWVWNKKETLFMNFDWSWSIVWDSWEIKVNIDTIDNIVKDYRINPGLIKWDVEWFEYNSIVWCKETIIKYKPILLISIYHNWKDFYEIKPLIESWGLWYKFKIRHLSTRLYAETLLICY